MIEAVRAYIKTIAEFLLFLIVIRLVSTENSRKYISLASGIILVLIASAPVINLFSGRAGDMDKLISDSIDTYSYSQPDFEAESKAVLEDVFLQELEKSVESDVSGFGMECERVDIGISDNFDSTGEIKSIAITVNNQTGGADEAESFLKRRYGAEYVEIIYQ